MQSSLTESLTLVDCGRKKFSLAVLREILPDIMTLLYFARIYELTVQQLSGLMATLFDTPLTRALKEGSHSVSLQDYLVDTVPDMVEGAIFEDTGPPPNTVLPLVWEMHEIAIAQSIADVGRTLVSTFERLPTAQGRMEFAHMTKMHRQRRTLGDYRAYLEHKDDVGNLLILDTSSSMSRETVSKIVGDVVQMALRADAHLAIVSNTAYHWKPGQFSVDAVMDHGQFKGTHYETLTPLMRQRWGKVITIADYDSSQSAFEHLQTHCSGHINEVIDISLVARPTFLSECVGQFADKVTPVLVSARALT